MKQLALPEGISGPQYIRLTINGEEHWALPIFLTVAQWREAQQATVTDNDKHTLKQFRMATIMLEYASQHGVPDDVVLMPSMGMMDGHDFKADPRFFLDVNGGWRLNETFDKFKKPDLAVIES